MFKIEMGDGNPVSKVVNKMAAAYNVQAEKIKAISKDFTVEWKDLSPAQQIAMTYEIAEFNESGSMFHLLGFCQVQKALNHYTQDVIDYVGKTLDYFNEQFKNDEGLKEAMETLNKDEPVEGVKNAA